MNCASFCLVSRFGSVPAGTCTTSSKSLARDCTRTKPISRRAVTLLLAFGATLFSFAGAQPTAHFSHIESTLPVTGAITPAPVAVVVDLSGNIYVSDRGNNSVVKLAPSATGYTQTTIMDGSSSPALVSPRGIAVDSGGNVYIADFGGGQIYKVPPSGSGYGAPTSLLSSDCGGNACAPAGITTNPYGWVMFTSWGDAHVWYVSASGGPAAQY